MICDSHLELSFFICVHLFEILESLMQLLFGIFELGFLFLDTLNEHLPHLVFFLLKTLSEEKEARFKRKE